MHQNFVIPYLYEAQHFWVETPPIIRSLKLHWQPLVFHCQAHTVPDNVHHLNIQQPPTYEKPETASAVLVS